MLQPSFAIVLSIALAASNQAESTSTATADAAPQAPAAELSEASPAPAEGAEEPAPAAERRRTFPDRETEIRTALDELARAIELAGATPVQPRNVREATEEARRGPDHRTAIARIELEDGAWVPMEVAVTRKGKYVSFILHSIEVKRAKAPGAGAGPKAVESVLPGNAAPNGRTDLKEVEDYLRAHPDAHVHILGA
jgi:hypothetical protein